MPLSRGAVFSPDDVALVALAISAALTESIGVLGHRCSAGRIERDSSSRSVATATESVHVGPRQPKVIRPRDDSFGDVAHNQVDVSRGRADDWSFERCDTAVNGGALSCHTHVTRSRERQHIDLDFRDP